MPWRVLEYEHEHIPQKETSKIEYWVSVLVSVCEFVYNNIIFQSRVDDFHFWPVCFHTVFAICLVSRIHSVFQVFVCCFFFFTLFCMYIRPVAIRGANLHKIFGSKIFYIIEVAVAAVVVVDFFHSFFLEFQHKYISAEISSFFSGFFFFSKWYLTLRLFIFIQALSRNTLMWASLQIKLNPSHCRDLRSIAWQHEIFLPMQMKRKNETHKDHNNR